MIIDHFPFFNELDLLEIRLNELKDVVDVFSISEATLTFTGDPKPLCFDENKNRFKNFNIHHTIVDDYSGIKNTPHAMDRGQKQRGLDAVINEFNPTGDDILIMSDCDEIPMASMVAAASKDDWDFAMLEMPLFYYYMNCRGLGRPGSWRNPRMMRPRGKKLPKYNIIRKGRSDKNYWNGGWHFSFLNTIKYKIDSYTHAPEFSKPPYNDPYYIEKMRSEGKDLFKRKRYKFEFVSDVSYLPQYVLDNINRFRKYIKEPF